MKHLAHSACHVTPWIFDGGMSAFSILSCQRKITLPTYRQEPCSWTGRGRGRGRTLDDDAANRGATRGITQSSITLRIQNQLATGQGGHSGAGSWAGRSEPISVEGVGGRARANGLIKAGAIALFSPFLFFLPLYRNICNWFQTNVYILWRATRTDRFWNKLRCICIVCVRIPGRIMQQLGFTLCYIVKSKRFIRNIWPVLFINNHFITDLNTTLLLFSAPCNMYDCSLQQTLRTPLSPGYCMNLSFTFIASHVSTMEVRNFIPCIRSWTYHQIC